MAKLISGLSIGFVLLITCLIAVFWLMKLSGPGTAP